MLGSFEDVSGYYTEAAYNEAKHVFDYMLTCRLVEKGLKEISLTWRPGGLTVLVDWLARPK